MANGDFAGSAFRNGRRTCLPAPCPDTSNINLWNILRNNIGKDLSKVSMPVELNEPLNTLQRMCEELEYSELLDKAAETEDPFERMVKKQSDILPVSDVRKVSCSVWSGGDFFCSDDGLVVDCMADDSHCDF